MITKFISRFNLDEPSTWASLATGLVAAGVSIPEPITAGSSLLLAGIFSLVGVFKREKGKK